MDQLLARPALFVGHESIVLISAYIDGYQHATGGALNDDLYRNFNDWVAKRFKIPSMHNWALIISFMGVSENAGFELARKLWQEYKSEVEANRNE